MGLESSADAFAPYILSHGLLLDLVLFSRSQTTLYQETD